MYGFVGYFLTQSLRNHPSLISLAMKMPKVTRNPINAQEAIASNTRKTKLQIRYNFHIFIFIHMISNLVLRGCVPFGQHQQQKSQSIWSPLTENARAMERGPVSYPESAGILVDAPLTKKPEDSGYEVGRGLTQCERKRWCVGTWALVTKRLTPSI